MILQKVHKSKQTKMGRLTASDACGTTSLTCAAIPTNSSGDGPAIDPTLAPSLSSNCFEKGGRRKKEEGEKKKRKREEGTKERKTMSTGLGYYLKMRVEKL